MNGSPRFAIALVIVALLTAGGVGTAELVRSSVCVSVTTNRRQGGPPVRSGTHHWWC